MKAGTGRKGCEVDGGRAASCTGCARPFWGGRSPDVRRHACRPVVGRDPSAGSWDLRRSEVQASCRSHGRPAAVLTLAGVALIVGRTWRTRPRCGPHRRARARKGRRTMEALIRGILENIGEDPQREGLLKTPERVAKAWLEITDGYHQDPDAMVRQALFEAEGHEMIVINDIDFFSMCEHHLLPFFGKAHVAYIPGSKIVGLSKIARVVDAFSRRLQVQERMTSQIAHCLQRNLDAQGVAVVLHAQHLCMMMRGIKRQNSFAVTSEMVGVFKDDSKTRSEFLTLIQEKPWN
ncbi:MAG: GTP cyclohydrolase I FolE [Gemmatimonas sp.]|nr:GTP cyclohydrolase I FolE [Gemmatimonas sp.]